MTNFQEPPPGWIEHTFISDPPANMLTKFQRETCSVCGKARITRPNGTQYGSAVVKECFKIV